MLDELRPACRRVAPRRADARATRLADRPLDLLEARRGRRAFTAGGISDLRQRGERGLDLGERPLDHVEGLVAPGAPAALRACGPGQARGRDPQIVRPLRQRGVALLPRAVAAKRHPRWLLHVEIGTRRALAQTGS